jgi:hypothetical protein
MDVFEGMLYEGLAVPVHQALGDFIEAITLMRRCCESGVCWNVGG